MKLRESSNRLDWKSTAYGDWWLEISLTFGFTTLMPLHQRIYSHRKRIVHRQRHRREWCDTSGGSAGNVVDSGTCDAGGETGGWVSSRQSDGDTRLGQWCDWGVGDVAV